LLGGKIPEITGFYHKYFNYSGLVFVGEQEGLFSGNKGKHNRFISGSFLSQFQLMMIYDLCKQNRTSDLAHNYGMWSPADFFIPYSDHLILDWFLDGIVGRIQIKDLIVPTVDKTLQQLQFIPELEGGFPLIDTSVDLKLVAPTNIPILMETGYPQINKRGEVLQVNKSKFITHEGKNAWNEPLLINGTLDLYNNPMSNNDQVTIFFPEYYSNFFFEPTEILYEFQFSLNLYRWKSKNLDRDRNIFDCRYPGFVNLTRFRGYDWMMSLRNLYNGKLS
jgi:hypothetical protein